MSSFKCCDCDRTNKLSGMPGAQCTKLQTMGCFTCFIDRFLIGQQATSGETKQSVKPQTVGESLLSI